MRARKKKNTPERLLKYSYLFLDKENRDDAFFENKKLKIEIGCGKGAFVSQSALLEPDVSFVGIEKVADVIATAAIKTDECGAKNIRLLMADASELCDYFKEHSVDTVYLNFSDPWPPNNRAKRRLTHRSFLEIYKKLLTPDGKIEFKTDNDKLFDFSVEEISSNGFEIIYLTRDLHSENIQNVVTEYEARFSQEGIPIKKLVAVLKK